MMMEPFEIRFPEITEKETRCMILMNEEDGLPKGEYFLLESYCNVPKCDCRRVFINVLHEDKILATIGYGWENLEFYEQWLSEKDMAPEMKGPILELGGVYTEYSRPLLGMFKEIMLADSIFIERLKRHYKIFKEVVDKEEAGIEGIGQRLKNFNMDSHTVASLCKEIGTGKDAISDTDLEAFFPLLITIEETIWSECSEDSSLKDMDVIKSLQNIRGNIFSENAKFNRLEEDIVKKIKLTLFMNSYSKKDVSLSISHVLRSVKNHRLEDGSRGYLAFISKVFNSEDDDNLED